MSVTVQLNGMGNSVELATKLTRQAERTLASVATLIDEVHITVDLPARGVAEGHRSSVRARLETGEIVRATVADETFLRAFLGSIAVLRRDVLRADARSSSTWLGR